MRTHFVKPNQPTVIASSAPHCYCEQRPPLVIARSAPRLSLRGAQRRGNLDEAEHTSVNHHCYGDEIATLRSQ